MKYNTLSEALYIFISRYCAPTSEIRLVLNSDRSGYIHLLGQDSETIDFNEIGIDLQTNAAALAKEVTALTAEVEKLKKNREIEVSGCKEQIQEQLLHIGGQAEEISKLKAERQELVETLRFRIDTINRNFNESTEVPFLQILLAKLNPQK